jgi:DNA-binding MarR family transcriptional regulator
MAENGSGVQGDFRVIKMDGLFHVVFRPDSDPEWFRIIATFYTYDRAYCYCDIERISSYEIWDDRGGNSDTATEVHDGLREPPIQIEPPEGWMGRFDGAPDLVRNICQDADQALPPQPEEDFTEYPEEGEEPKDFYDRQYAQAIAKAADAPICQICGKPRSPGSAALCRDCYQGKVPAEDTAELTDKQRAVLEYFLEHANPLRLVSASYKQIATEARVSNGSIVYLVETLEREGFIEVVERGAGKRSSVFKLVPEKIMETAPAIEAAAE